VPLAVAIAFGVLYLLLTPHSSDLAAQTARSELFRRSGYVPYWTGWYAGIPTATYSLVSPPLLGWLGPVWLGAMSVVATAAVAGPLLRDSARPVWGTTFFVLAAALDVVSGRITFALGAVIAVAAVLAAERRRGVATAALAALATAASPVAGFLLLVVAAALLVADRARRRCAAAMVVGIAVIFAALAYLSRGGPGGGYEPFTQHSLLMTVPTAAVAVVLPVSRRVRVGAVLTVAMLLAAYFVHSAVGANATRLAILGTAPAVVATVRAPRWLLVVGVLAASLLPLSQARNDLVTAHDDYTSRAVVAPLLARLSADPHLADRRVEVIDAAAHWSSTYLLPTVALARGWERQIDESVNPMFYGRAPLTADSYRAFLNRNAVGYVAEATGVPKLDYGVTSERALVAAGLGYLTRVWSNPHWVLYAVNGSTPIVSAPAEVTQNLDTGVVIDAPRSGRYAVRLRWSPYLVVDGGQVSRTPDGQVAVMLDSAGSHRLHAVWRMP
jgi:MFS family permease